MILIQYTFILFAVYLCVYALINRICKCIEHCATARAYSKFRENGIPLKIEDVAAGIVKMNDKKKKAEEYVEKGIN